MSFVANLTLKQKGFILIAVPLFFELLFVGILCWLLNQAESDADRAWHAEIIREQTLRIHYTVGEAVLFMNSYTSSRDPNFREKLEHAESSLAKELATFDALAESRAEKDAIRHVRQTLEEGLLAALDIGQAGADVDDPASRDTLRRSMTDVTGKYLEDLRRLTQKADSICATGPIVQARNRSQISLCLEAGVVVNIAVAIWLALIFNRSTVGRIHILMDNTVRMTEEKDLNSAIGGTDEIGQLDAVFHTMATTLKESAEVERELIKLKEDLLSMATHDLRAPLSSIGCGIEILLAGISGSLPDKAHSDLTNMHKSIEKLTDMINDWLDFEKLRQGHLELDLDFFPIDEAVTESIKVLEKSAAGRSIKIESQVENIQIKADEMRLFQVINNFLSNAIKFSPEGGTITITSASAAGQLKIMVADQGTGIPEQKALSIFEPYKQLTNTTTKSKGTGLGLAICKMIVDHHKGEIGVFANPSGQGSVFWFTIPLTDAHSDANQRLAETKSRMF